MQNRGLKHQSFIHSSFRFPISCTPTNLRYFPTYLLYSPTYLLYAPTIPLYSPTYLSFCPTYLSFCPTYLSFFVLPISHAEFPLHDAGKIRLARTAFWPDFQHSYDVLFLPQTLTQFSTLAAIVAFTIEGRGENNG